MLATTSLPPVSEEVTLSHTSMIYSQFSEVRFSSVALAALNVNIMSQLFHTAQLTHDIVESILLGAKHDEAAVE